MRSDFEVKTCELWIVPATLNLRDETLRLFAVFLWLAVMSIGHSKMHWRLALGVRIWPNPYRFEYWGILGNWIVSDML